MNKLRNIAIAVLASTMLFSIAGVVFAYYQLWFAALIFLFATIIMSTLSVLLIARYMAWNARTGEQRLKVTTQELSARVNTAIKQQDKANVELREANEELRELITSSQASQQREFTQHKELLEAIQTNLASHSVDISESVAWHSKATKRQITSATRDSTRQIESLVHLYQRYPNVKLPMPNTGGFAIDSQALAHLIALVEERRPQRILELGSGTSTIWLGYLCRSFAGTVVTLDHLEHYLQRTVTAVKRHQLEDVIEARLAPLEPVELGSQTYDWYSLASMTDLSDIDMLVIDGPPAATGPQARYPALPHVVQLLSPNATVVLDDAHRNDEAEIVASWQREYPEFREIEQGTSRLAVLERVATQ